MLDHFKFWEKRRGRERAKDASFWFDRTGIENDFGQRLFTGVSEKEDMQRMIIAYRDNDIFELEKSVENERFFHSDFFYLCARAKMWPRELMSKDETKIYWDDNVWHDWNKREALMTFFNDNRIEICNTALTTL